jgi:hypothetical protein
VTLYFDVSTRNFVTSPGYRDVVSALTFKRGDNLALAVKFCSGTTILELASGATGKMGMKEVGDFDGDLVGGALSWTKTGTGTSTVYTFDLNLNTAELNTLLGVGEAADVASVNLNMEMEYIVSGQVTSSNTILATVQNDVNRDEDETPTGLPDAEDWLTDRAVRYDEAQSLSDPEKAQAITNIGASTPASVDAQIVSNRNVTETLTGQKSFTQPIVSTGTPSADTHVLNRVQADVRHGRVFYASGELSNSTTTPQTLVELTGLPPGTYRVECDIYIQTPNVETMQVNLSLPVNGGTWTRRNRVTYTLGSSVTPVTNIAAGGSSSAAGNVTLASGGSVGGRGMQRVFGQVVITSTGSLVLTAANNLADKGETVCFAELIATKVS